MTANDSVLPLVKGGSWEDDCLSIFCPPRWLHPIIGKPITWWHLVPLSWPVVVKEWGQGERGMENKIAPGTWESCHDRRIALELKHFCEINFHVDKQEKSTVARLVVFPYWAINRWDFVSCSFDYFN